MLTQTQNTLIKMAAEAAIELDKQLTILLDAYDFYVQRYHADTPSATLEFNDLQDTISQIAVLPQFITLRLEQWHKCQETTQSCIGFEMNVLNEMALHIYALASFMIKKGIDLEGFDSELISEALSTFRRVNKTLS